MTYYNHIGWIVFLHFEVYHYIIIHLKQYYQYNCLYTSYGVIVDKSIKHLNCIIVYYNVLLPFIKCL